MGRIARRLLGVVTVAALTSCAGGHDDSGQASPLVGRPAPSFELPMLDGSQFRLADVSGQSIVMVDFWATWCGPCVEEMPLLVQIADEFKSQGVVFCAVNEGDDAQRIKAFQSAKKLDFPVALDQTGEAAGKYGVEGIPTLVLVDKNGVIQSVHVGYNPGIKRTLRRELLDLLAGKDLAAEAAANRAPKTSSKR